MRYNFWLKTLLVVAIILYGTLLLAGKAEANSSDNQAPEWVISEWINSNGLTLAGLRGKVVVIDFLELSFADITGNPLVKGMQVVVSEHFKPDSHLGTGLVERLDNVQLSEMMVLIGVMLANQNDSVIF